MGSEFWVSHLGLVVRLRDHRDSGGRDSQILGWVLDRSFAFSEPVSFSALSELDRRVWRNDYQRVRTRWEGLCSL